MNEPQRPICPCVKECQNRSAECAKSCEAWEKYESERATFYKERWKRKKAMSFDDGMTKILGNIVKYRQKGRHHLK